MLLTLLLAAGILPLSLFSVCNGARSTRGLSSDDRSRIDSFVDNLLQCRHIPGLSLAVVTSEQVLLKKGYGLANVEKHKPVTEHTLFPIASTSKAFTTTLLAKLIQEHPDKKFDWDTPIYQLLGQDFRLYDDVLTRMTTLRDLLSHRTGVAGNFIPLMAGVPKNMTRKEFVRKLRYHPPKAPFRSKFYYNNYMYVLAGHVAEVIEQKDWETLIQQYLFTPLSMTSSRFVRDINSSIDLASSYVFHSGRTQAIDTEVLYQVDASGPAGSILSSANDMSKWLQFHLRGGKLPSGEQLVKRQLLEDTYRGEIPSPNSMNHMDFNRPTYPISDMLVSYGLAWVTNFYRGYRRLWHSGGISTYKTMVWFYPDMDIGLYVSINGPPGEGSSLAHRLALEFISDLLLEETPWLNVSTACSFPAPWKTVRRPYTFVFPNDAPARPYADYEGTYSHPGYGDVIISHNATSDHLRLRMGRWMDAILHYNKSMDCFWGQFTGVYWYESERLKLRFGHSEPDDDDDSSDIDTLDFLFHDATMGPFVQGPGKSYLFHSKTMNGHCDCTSGVSHCAIGYITYASLIHLLWCLLSTGHLTAV